jgi:hypothetical protein
MLQSLGFLVSKVTPPPSHLFSPVKFFEAEILNSGLLRHLRVKRSVRSPNGGYRFAASHCFIAASGFVVTTCSFVSQPLRAMPTPIL